MALGLTVVTHTSIEYSRDLSRCIESVKTALPLHSEHVIIRLPHGLNELIEARFAAMKLNDVVVFVDDDDYISDSSLRYCLAALSETSAGIAYTNEIKVDSKSLYSRSTNATCYEDVYNNPTSIHHMTAYRTKYVNERSKVLSHKYLCSPEWIIKVDAMVTSGSAIFIPVDGYYWSQHPIQLHRDSNYQGNYRSNSALVKREMLQWGELSGEIPKWDINKSK